MLNNGFNMNDHLSLISKFVDKKSLMAIVMFTQSVIAAEEAFIQFESIRNNKTIPAPTKAMRSLAYARYFCEACGWCALALRRLRHDDEKHFSGVLLDNKKHIDSLYNVRIEVNHKYNEELIDAYVNSNYDNQRHQKNLAFNYSIAPEGVGFRIGTLEISMVSQLASMKKIETDLLGLNQ
jgi:MinD superfamily P-loop ATPase